MVASGQGSLRRQPVAEQDPLSGTGYRVTTYRNGCFASSTGCAQRALLQSIPPLSFDTPQS